MEQFLEWVMTIFAVIIGGLIVQGIVEWSRRNKIDIEIQKR